MAFRGKHIVSKSNKSAGIIGMNINDVKSFVSLNATNGPFSKSLYNATLDNGQYWQSPNEMNSTFTMTFNKNVVRLESISLFSCQINNCVRTFTVSGSNKEESWEPICTIARTNETFKGKFTNVECKSNFTYKSIKLTQIAFDSNGSYYFTIYHIDLYGFLFPLNPVAVSMCALRKQFHLNLLNCVLIVCS